MIWVSVTDWGYQELCPSSSTLCLGLRQAGPTRPQNVFRGGDGCSGSCGGDGAGGRSLVTPQLSPRLLWVSYQMLLLDLEGANTSRFL